MRFKGKVALITAAASGIGRATANIIGRRRRTHRRRRQQSRAAGRDRSPRSRLPAARPIAYNADALDEAGWTARCRRRRQALRQDRHPRQCRGRQHDHRQARRHHRGALTLADWQSLIHFNLTGTFLFTHAVIPVMKRQRSGKIVNLASIAGRGKSSASSSAYATAKGGIIALTTKLANELGPYGINVNAIAPATTLTERIRPRWEQRPPEERAGRYRQDAAAAHGRGGGPGQRHLLPRLLACRFRHRPHHRRDGRALSSVAMQPANHRQRGRKS